jgi:hypothetical protein
MKCNVIILLAIIFLSTACEEEVVLDLKSIEKKLIVEATLTDEMPAVKVLLSYSQDFYDTPEYNPIIEASVELSDEDGTMTILVPDSAGFFNSGNLVPRNGEKYTLHINVDDYSFEVSSLLPEMVDTESVSFVPNPFAESPDSLNAFVNVQNPKAQESFFRLFISKIGVPFTREFYMVDNTLNENGIFTMPVYYKIFAPGDTMVLELRHLNRETYTYYSGLNENISGSFNSIAPGNPNTNMPDDIYGFFAGYSITRDTVIVGAGFPF